MKTVGIFGDSYADCSYITEWKTTYNNIGPGWPELLADNYEVTNFAEGGSGMYFSYNLFKKMQSNFDIIVFVPSHAARFSIFLPDSNNIQHIVPNFLLSQSKLELDLRKNMPNDIKVIKAAIGYVSCILNQDKEIEMKRLMFQEIQQTRPDTIFVPAFGEDKTDGFIELFEITKKELDHYNTSFNKLQQRNPPLLDARKCHMTEGNNRAVFNKVISAIENKDTFVRLTESDFVAPTDPFSKYFVYNNGCTNI